MEKIFLSFAFLSICQMTNVYGQNLQASLPEKTRFLASSEEVSPEAFDQPELDYENRIYRIYRDFNSELIPSEEWTKMAKGNDVETYNIQKGDTLWGISTAYFGNGHYWPKMWAVNGEITNPHEISPSKVIRFYPGTLDNEPSVELGQSNGHVSKGGDLGTKNEISSDAEIDKIIPPPINKVMPVLLLPPSLPSSLARKARGKSTIEFDTSMRPRISPPSVFQLTGYFTAKAEPDNLGSVVETEFGGNIAGAGQYVYVRGKELQLGSEYVVLNRVGRISLKSSFFTKGSVIEVLGRIRVVSLANRGKSIYRALVTYSVSPIAVGSYVAKGKIENYRMTKTSNLTFLERGKIIGGRYEGNRQIFGKGDIVFLNLGLKQGVDVGTLLPLVLDQKTRNRGSDVNLAIKRIGAVKVVKVEEDVSTAVILYSSEEISVGDIVGGGGEELGAESPEIIAESDDEGLEDSSDGEEELEDIDGFEDDFQSEEGSFEDEGFEGE